MTAPLLRPMEESIDLCGKKGIVKSQPYIVGENPLAVVFPAGVLMQQHSAELIELPELRKVSETFHMSAVIRKNLVKKQIAVLKTSGMHRDYRNPRLEQAVSRADQSVRMSDAPSISSSTVSQISNANPLCLNSSMNRSA